MTDKQNAVPPSSSVDPTIYSGLSRSFVGLPESRRNNAEEFLPHPLFRRESTALNNISSDRAGIASPRNGRNLGDGINNRDRDLEAGESHPSDHEVLLSPKDVESQSSDSSSSTRVLTPPHAQPSAFLNGSTARTAGFLSRQHTGPGNRTFEPSSPYNYDTVNPYRYETYGNGGLRRGSESQTRPVSPLSPLLKPVPTSSAMTGALRGGEEPVVGGLDSLVRGPGGLRKSASGMTVSTVSSAGIFSGKLGMRGYKAYKA